VADEQRAAVWVEVRLGDQDLLVLSDDLPILTPAQFATKLRQSR
jgi:predicted nucleic acid-binding protein